MMGNSTSSTVPKMSDEDSIHRMCRDYYLRWSNIPNLCSQSDLFRRIVPKEEVDFTEEFYKNGLDGIFTNPGLPLKITYGYNCNHLYRDTLGKMKIPIFNDDKFVVIHPMGAPGRDLGPGHSAKVSHLMVVTHSEDGPITFNEMLPSNTQELNDLKERILILNQAYSNLKADSPISMCGQKVIDRAIEMGVDPKTGIRSFMAHQIYNLSESDKKGLPGYKLLDKRDIDICKDEGTILSTIHETFDDDSLSLMACIQGPDKNTQILSHMHGFMINDIPDTLNEIYIDCNVILKVKRSTKTVSIKKQGLCAVEEEGDLCRTGSRMGESRRAY